MTANRIKRTLVWFARIGCCRGFGIQSPWAYSLVRYVINEHFPYYAYEQLRAAFPGSDAVRRKVDEFLLRLANFVQPSAVVTVTGDMRRFESSKAYLQAGCRSLQIVDAGNTGGKSPVDAVGSIPGQHILYADAAALDIGTLRKVLDVMPTGDFVVLDGLWKSKAAWREAAKDIQGVVTFDMYYCGLIYVDAKRYKQNYKINF